MWVGPGVGLSQNPSSRSLLNPSPLISLCVYLLLLVDLIPFLLRNYYLFIPRDTGPSMDEKARVFFSSSHNGKGTSLRRDEGGFSTADSRPLISGFLVRCGEGTLLYGEVLCRGEPVALCWSNFFVFYSSVLFSCLLAARLIPLSPYFIEQDNMRD